jgi:hypothetical protein
MKTAEKPAIRDARSVTAPESMSSASFSFVRTSLKSPCRGTIGGIRIRD